MDVHVVGVGTPKEFAPYMKSGTIDTLLLWDPDLSGYVMCKLAADILAGENIGDGEGYNAGVDGYKSMTLNKDTNRTLIGQAELVVTPDTVDDYEF